MPTVAELDVQVDAKDNASATIMALDALIKGLDKDDVDIDIGANTAEIQAKIQELLARLRELDSSDPDIDIDINSAGATAELARLRAELDALRDESIRVRVNDSEVRRARTSMNEFRTSSMMASRSVSAVAAAAISLGTALIPIGAVAVGAIGSLVTAFSTAALGVGLFAGVAVTAFGGVKDALKEITKAQDDYNKAATDDERDIALQKLNAIMEGLDPATRKMVQSVLDFKSAWRSFADQFKPQIFQIAQEGLAGLTGLLPSLAPMVQGAADAFLSLERSLVASLGSPWWQSWLGEMGSVMQPMIEGLVRTLGNLATGFAGLMLAFMPLTLDFTKGMEGMSKSFADWAKGLEDSQGFKNFIAYIRENMPLVKDLIGSLAGAFVAVLKAGAPLGEALVIIATKVFDMMTAFQEAHPMAATLGLALLGILTVALKLVGPVLSIAKLFSILASATMTLAAPLGALAGFLGITVAALLGIIAVIALVIGAFIYAYTHFEGFRDVVDAVARAVADFAVRVYDAIVVGLGVVADWLVATFGPAVQAVMDFAVEQFDKVMAWARENAPLFQEAWQNIVTFVQAAMVIIGAVIATTLAVISAIWTAVWPTLSLIVQGAWEAIKGIISGALDIIMGIITMWAGIFAGDWSAIWDGIVQILTGAWEIIFGVLRGAFIMMEAIVAAGAAVLIAALGLLWEGIKGAAQTAWDAIVAVVRTAWDVLTTVVSTAASAIQDAINAFWDAVIALFQAAWDGIVAGMQSFWDTLTDLASAAWDALKNIFTTAMNVIQDAINAFWDAVIALFQAAWDGIVAGMQSFWDTLTDLASTAMNAILALISAAWAAIQAAIQTALSAIRAAAATAWDAITALIRAAMSTILSVVTSGWSTIRSAIGTEMSNILSAIRTGMSNAVSAVSTGISNMVSIVTGAAGRFLSAGRALMENLAQGILGGIGAAVGAVRNAVGQLTSLLPGSPAKTGPLSGQGYALIRGRHLTEDLAAGIAGRAGLVAQAVGDLADLMTLNLDSETAFAAIANGSASSRSGGGDVTISIAPGAIVLQVGNGVTAADARQAFDGAAGSLADELLTAIRRR